MTPPAFVGTQPLIDYLTLNTGRPVYSVETLGSNIRAASFNLERWTGHIFGDSHRTLTFSTRGRAIIPLPGLRQISGAGATWNSALLSFGANPSAWLLPDAQQTGLYSGLQLRLVGRYSRGYLSSPEWFDRGFDSPYWPGNYAQGSQLPNDLVVEGDWGYLDDGLPEPLVHATKILAGWYTLRPDSILANVKVDTSGNVLNYGELPPEVGSFVAEWRIGEMAADIG